MERKGMKKQDSLEGAGILMVRSPKAEQDRRNSHNGNNSNLQ